MVYCGKPSKGCSNCRERKIRCDQREPGCGQCEKRQQTCPGYRNIVDLMFRDESSHVAQKARKRPRKRTNPSTDKPTTPTTPLPGKSASTPTTPPPPRKSSPFVLTASPSAASSSGFFDQRDDGFIQTGLRSPAKLVKADRGYVKQEPGMVSPRDALAVVPSSLSPSFEERGLNFFIARYISVPPDASQNKFDFVFDLWSPSPFAYERARDPVLASITAVGLLSVAQRAQSQEPMEAARKTYGQALRLTNTALRSPTGALEDTTMLAVLVLGYFETMAGAGARSMRAWQQHINGAAALARLRGMGSFRSKAGIKMFMMQCSSIMINCIQNKLAMPQDLIGMRTQLVDMMGGPAAVPGYEVYPPIYKILQLRYDICQGTITDIDTILDIFNEAEEGFEKALSLFPETWQYGKFCLSERLQTGFFSDVCHVYPNLSVASVWNGTRAIRMLILETMLEELHMRFLQVPVEKVPARYQIEAHKVKVKLERIALAILASVPQHFGLIRPSDPSLNTLVPMPHTEDMLAHIPETGWKATLGQSEGSVSRSSEDKDYDCRSPSFSNPMQARSTQAQEERLMLLASVSSGLVWPLYLVGMSTASSASMKSFVIERLHALHDELDVTQAGKLADAVASHKEPGKPSEHR
ncbi:hypothetical protein M406DRAFT_348983 [Cryphonectria parasitica EP155]|uniref:Zn(2)-C6 fungal-type domain-containing protein n=1 Tax=Cryphonectria parasitica (strain ATCC 38755 / EP155) TaxID=660469 RepID=A0A9P5CTR9_CRYP1|nr:uncharacterized protein M406DRAFT_348983 [Cryphonectria parasitica EP155]KAF3769982.1 hypothetical protein M406DRAFT_348983 [Cryphonectria parasitica EP155]